MTNRSVLYSVYEFLPPKSILQFFVRSARFWHEHYTTIPTEPVARKRAYIVLQNKYRKLLNEMLAELQEPQ